MSNDLIIPIYLDTNALLDLLATIEGGFSVVERISSQTAHTREAGLETDVDGGTEFGIPNVLNLLKLNVRFGANVKRSGEETLSKESERYHTYGSLFHRLRDYLVEQKLIKRIDGDQDRWDEIHSSDFVEIHGIFEPNPLMHSLSTIDGLIEIMQLLNPSPRKGQSKKVGKDQFQELQQIRKFIRGLLADVESENIRSFVINSVGKLSYQAVVLLYLDYLRDKTMTEVSYREYSLLGKVVRKVNDESEPPIDLLMGRSLRGLGDEVLEQLISALKGTPQMNLPEIRTKIPAPALEIVPIAVYV